MSKSTTMIALFCVLLIGYSNVSLADWFLSKETKALIKKADAGDAEAQFRVGSAYDTGEGAPRNGENAMKYYLMAAEQGYAEAQNSVGSALQAEESYSEALTWYIRAADQGHALATNNLAYLYDLGLGVKQDRHKAFELYTQAANLGWAEAMWNIANMYGAGQLGENDMASACVWSLRARRYAEPSDQRLNAHLAKVIPHLQSTLSSSGMEKCKQEADSWEPKHKAQQGTPGDAPRAARP